MQIRNRNVNGMIGCSFVVVSIHNVRSDSAVTFRNFSRASIEISPKDKSAYNAYDFQGIGDAIFMDSS